MCVYNTNIKHIMIKTQYKRKSKDINTQAQTHKHTGTQARKSKNIRSKSSLISFSLTLWGRLPMKSCWLSAIEETGTQASSPPDITLRVCGTRVSLAGCVIQQYNAKMLLAVHASRFW